jgi:hypothetical protein
MKMLMESKVLRLVVGYLVRRRGLVNAANII